MWCECHVVSRSEPCASATGGMHRPKPFNRNAVTSDPTFKPTSFRTFVRTGHNSKKTWCEGRETYLSSSSSDLTAESPAFLSSERLIESSSILKSSCRLSRRAFTCPFKVRTTLSKLSFSLSKALAVSTTNNTKTHEIARTRPNHLLSIANTQNWKECTLPGRTPENSCAFTAHAHFPSSFFFFFHLYVY